MAIIKKYYINSTWLTYESMTYLLLFLFPIAGVSVRGWFTNIYNVLCLISLFYLRRRKQAISRTERIFLYTFVFYFGVLVISSLWNGWHFAQSGRLGTEIRFMMAIPIYLLVREQRASWHWYLYGSLLGIFFIFAQSYYDVHWRGLSTAWGVYSKNLIGPFAALLTFYILYLWNDRKEFYWKGLIVVAFMLGVWSTALSGSRGGYVGFTAMAVAWLILNLRGRWVIVGAIVMLGGMGLVYKESVIARSGVNRALSSFVAYIDNPDKAHAKYVMDSTETHLEMWRAAEYFFPDHPIIGVGPGNYQATARKYAKEGKVNPIIAQHGHPHNIFLEALYSTGLIGLISLLLMLYYPFYKMFITRRSSQRSAGLGMLHIIGITGFSMFDASPLLFNNYTSILLLGIVIFWAHHVNEVKFDTPGHV